MLCLGRHVGEEILIGDDIVITVVEIERGRVKLGITAPRELRVDRREIREAREREKRRKEQP